MKTAAVVEDDCRRSDKKHSKSLVARHAPGYSAVARMSPNVALFFN